jgi:hypothetical protein
MSLSAKSLNAKNLPQASLADLVATYQTANNTLKAALDLVDEIETKPLPAIRVFGGKTDPKRPRCHSYGNDSVFHLVEQVLVIRLGLPD